MTNKSNDQRVAPDAVFIPLNEAQLRVLEPFFAHVKAEAEAGRPGMLLAQIGFFGNTEMKVGFFRHDVAKKWTTDAGFNAPDAPMSALKESQP